MEGEKRLLEGRAGAKEAGCSAGTGSLSCWVLLGIPGRQLRVNHLHSAGLLGVCVRQKATASAEKFAGSMEMNCHVAQSVRGD